MNESKLHSKTCIRIKIPIVNAPKFVDFIRKNSGLCSLHVFDILHSPEKLTSYELECVLANMFEDIFKFEGFKSKEKVLLKFFKDLIDAHCMTTPIMRFIKVYCIAADRFTEHPEICSNFNSILIEAIKRGFNQISRIKDIYFSLENKKITNNFMKLSRI
jgi:hypothetical protein